MNFTNEELVLIFKKAVIEKKKLDAAIERRFTVVTTLVNEEPGEMQMAAQAKILDDLAVQKIQDSVIYKSYDSIISKLEPVVELILDGDIETKNKFRNIS